MGWQSYRNGPYMLNKLVSFYKINFDKDICIYMYKYMYMMYFFGETMAFISSWCQQYVLLTLIGEMNLALLTDYL